MTREVAPYGTWRSPITGESIARGSVTLSEPFITAGGHLWWMEGRPSEGGRKVIVRDGEDFLPEGFSARTRAHEYGGGAYLVDGDAVVFSNDEDGRLYRLEPGGEPQPVTPEPRTPRALRYADGNATYWVRENHEGPGEAVTEIVDIATGSTVASGADFYAAPRLSPDGTRLAWISWNHPRMSWDGTELWVANPDGSDASLVAGGDDVSVISPRWSPDGVLHWASDESGWWNLYRDGEPLHPAEAEFGGPLWVFGEWHYEFLADGRIACMWMADGYPHIGLLDPGTSELEELDVPYVPGDSERIVTDGSRVAYVGASPSRTAAVVVLDTAGGDLEVVARSTGEEPDPGYISEAQPVDYDSHGRTAHALYYPPRNADFEPPGDELPPLLVLTHGGPTGHALPHLDLEIQFWTSRGIAVVDVNYGGSTGYGRAYRELLRGQWGIVDVQDAAEAARHLAAEGKADPERLAIAGGSAGGYTTLAALAWTDVFRAGAAKYAVVDIEPLFAETHKLESRYGEALVPADQYAARSPINSVDRISAPVIVFQGLEDAVVVPEQSELIVAALARQGIDHEYRTYEGEGHGFRKAETIIDMLESELRFFGRVFGFEPAG